jgi:hypothetical protein
VPRPLALTFLLASLALTGAASAQPLTARPEANWRGVEITSDNGGVLVYFVGVRVVNGRIAVCGTGFTPKTHAGHLRHVPGIIADMRITLGTTLLPHVDQDFRFYPSEAEMRKGPAGCTLTRVAADPALLRQPLRIGPRKGYSTDW